MDFNMMTQDQLESVRDDKLKALVESRDNDEKLMAAINEYSKSKSKLEIKLINVRQSIADLRAQRVKARNVIETLENECEFIKSKIFKLLRSRP